MVVASVGGALVVAAVAVGALLATRSDDPDPTTFPPATTTFDPPASTSPDPTAVTIDPVDDVPIHGGTLAVGEYLDVELGPGGATATLVVSLSNGEFDVAAEPLDGQDIVLTYRGEDGDIVEECNLVDGGAGGVAEWCSFEAGGDVQDEIIITPYDDDDGSGMVRISANWSPATPPPDPSVLLADLDVPGWVEDGNEPAAGLFTCAGPYDTNAYDGHAQYWLSDAGWGAAGVTMVFETPEAAGDYVTTMAESYYAGCTVPMDAGWSFVFDDLSTTANGDVIVGYSVLDADGEFLYAGVELVMSVGQVAIDVSCDGDGSDCDGLFAAAVDRLRQLDS